MNINFTKAKWQEDSEGFYITLKTENKQVVKQFVQEMKDKIYVAELKEYKQRRSNDANSYCWVLMQKLAEKMNIKKEEIYRMAIKDIGVFETLPIKNEAIETFIQAWQSKGLGWVCENIGESKLAGYTNVLAYYGSSLYTTAQMSRLVNSIVEDCKLQNIDTVSPNELNKMIGEWGK